MPFNLSVAFLVENTWRQKLITINHKITNNRTSFLFWNKTWREGGGGGHQRNFIGSTTNIICLTAINWCLLMQIAIASHQYHKSVDKLFMFTACVTDYCGYTYQVNNNTQEWYSHLWLRFTDLNGVHLHNKNIFTLYQQITFKEPTQRYKAWVCHGIDKCYQMCPIIHFVWVIRGNDF